MSSNIKTAKRGDIIFKEGDKITSLLLMQSGASSLTITRPKKNIDVLTVSPSHILGEQAFINAQTHNLSLVANAEVKYMEFPIEAAKAQIEAAPQFLKMVIKSLTDRLRIAMNDLKTKGMDRDPLPCPEDQVAKAFATLFHTVKHKGKAEDEKNPTELSLDWTGFKQYAQRIFGESPRRMEQVCNIFVKLKQAHYTMGKSIDDPNGPDEIQKLTLGDLPTIESFFEFYQYYYFKGGVSSILKYDDSVNNLLLNFLKLAEGLTPDKLNSVSLEFPKILEHFKTTSNITLNNGHFAQLEAKGLFAKRGARSSDGVVVVSFDIKEWTTYSKIWRILFEIEKWNEKGFVDLHEEDPAKAKKKTGVNPCSSCGAELAANAKFCAECGTKVEAKVA